MQTKIKFTSRFFIVFFAIQFLLLLACSKENITGEEAAQEVYLKFDTNSKSGSTVLYSNWIKSEFPTGSQNNSEFFSLPFIKKKFFDADKDLLFVYGKRNNIFNLPVTIAASLESYSVELMPNPFATTVRLRVSSIDLAPLQNIFFRATAESQFRVIIVPSEKLLGLKSKKTVDFEKMTYKEIAEYFGIPQ